jgi:hypothetical protein
VVLCHCHEIGIKDSVCQANVNLWDVLTHLAGVEKADGNSGAWVVCISGANPFHVDTLSYYASLALWTRPELILIPFLLTARASYDVSPSCAIFRFGQTRNLGLQQANTSNHDGSLTSS